jgi:hypothetical protein
MTRGHKGCSSILQEDGEAEEDAAEERGQAEGGVGHEDSSGTLVVGAAAATASRGSTAETGDGDLGCSRCSAAVGWGRGAGGGRGSVALDGGLGTAGVVLAVESVSHVRLQEVVVETYRHALWQLLSPLQLSTQLLPHCEQMK